MTEQGPGNGGWQQRDLVPRPDPTALTNQAIDRVTEQYRQEVGHLRELIETRLDAMDKAFVVHADVASHLRDEIEEKVRHLRELTEVQFRERDDRMADSAQSNKEALAAALESARQLVQLQNQANTREAEKTERSVNERVGQLSIRMDAAVAANSDRISELKERIDRGEGISTGAVVQRGEGRAGRMELNQTAAVVISVIAVIVAIASVIALVVKKLQASCSDNRPAGSRVGHPVVR